MTVFFQLGAEVNKSKTLACKIASYRSSVHHVDSGIFKISVAELNAIPGSPFCYWLPREIRGIFSTVPAFEQPGRDAVVGLKTSDDTRFVRTWWEVPSGEIGAKRTWAPFAKGGKYGRFYADLPFVVQWGGQGAQLWAYYSAHSKRTGGMVKNPGFYFRPGITWPLRTHSFSPQVLPAGCIFSLRGYGAFSQANELSWLIALCSSRLYDYLFKLMLGRIDHPEFVVGVLRKVPTPVPGAKIAAYLGTLGEQGWRIARLARQTTETSRDFQHPSLLCQAGTTVGARSLSWNDTVARLSDELDSLLERIDDACLELYGVDTKEIRSEVRVCLPLKSHFPQFAASPEEQCADLLQFAIGVSFGRHRHPASDGEQRTPYSDPFQESMVPTLCDSVVQTKTPEEIRRVAGVLVDDSGHDADVVVEISRHIDGWTSGCLDEMRTILGTPVRIWCLSRLFDHHLSRFSVVGRKAPIYWQLATPSASYSIWCYYHRLTRDTFFRVVNDYVTPKVDHEESKLNTLRQEAGPDPSSTQRKAIDAQETFVGELRAFKAEVTRIAPLWNPNLNDGVIINFAPLWRLVPQHKPWQKECKKVWDKLVKGDYDWAHLAMHLWPERVVPKCQDDRSLAIAHGLEDDLWYEDDDGKWQKRKVSIDQIEELIVDRASTTVKAALKDLLEAPAPVGQARRRRRARA